MSGRLTVVPAHEDEEDLKRQARALSREERARRAEAVAEAARRLRLELVGVGADLGNIPAGLEVEHRRTRARARDMVDRLAALDAWHGALTAR